MVKGISYLNGRFVGPEAALLSIEDRGVRFGDGVFETLRVERGVPYQWDAHLARLLNGLRALRIAPPGADLRAVARAVLHQNAAESGTLRIMVTRGAGSKGYLPTGSGECSLVMEWLEAVPLPIHPLRLYVSSYRRVPPACLPVDCKLMQGLGSSLAQMEAAEHGADEALQLSPAGMIACAASASVYWIKGRSVFTPALEAGAMAGTVRARLLQLSPYPLQEVQAPLADLLEADAVFISNSRLGVWPVSAIEPLGYREQQAHPMVEEIAQVIHKDIEDDYARNCLYWKA